MSQVVDIKELNEKKSSKKKCFRSDTCCRNEQSDSWAETPRGIPAYRAVVRWAYPVGRGCPDWRKRWLSKHLLS